MPLSFGTHERLARAASFQVQSNASIKGKRRHTLVLEPRSLPPIPAEVSEGYVLLPMFSTRPNNVPPPNPRRPASAEELEAAKWRDEVVKLMLTAEGHKEIHEGLERFRQQGMPSLTTSSSPQPGIPNLVTCTLPSVCSCGPCLRAERQRNNNALPNVVSPLY